MQGQGSLVFLGEVDADVLCGGELLEGHVFEAEQVQAAEVSGHGAQGVFGCWVVEIDAARAEQGNLEADLLNLVGEQGFEVLQRAQAVHDGIHARHVRRDGAEDMPGDARAALLGHLCHLAVFVDLDDTPVGVVGPVIGFGSFQGLRQAMPGECVFGGDFDGFAQRGQRIGRAAEQEEAAAEVSLRPGVVGSLPGGLLQFLQAGLLVALAHQGHTQGDAPVNIVRLEFEQPAQVGDGAIQFADVTVGHTQVVEKGVVVGGRAEEQFQQEDGFQVAPLPQHAHGGLHRIDLRAVGLPGDFDLLFSDAQGFDQTANFIEQAADQAGCGIGKFRVMAASGFFGERLQQNVVYFEGECFGL